MAAARSRGRKGRRCLFLDAASQPGSCRNVEMKARKLISLLLLAAYLFATVGAAVLSVTCKCVAMKPRVEQYLCCSHCQLPAHVQPADGEFRSHCCGNHHSTDIALYTSPNSDDSEKYLKCAVYDLPPSMAAESVMTLSALSSFCGNVCCPVPLPQSVDLPGTGLRAPPFRA